jgi:cold-inducible RNA-binding protein
MNIHVANLPREFEDEQIKKLFSEYGTVESVHADRDKVTGKPTGFAFVTMGNDDEGTAAITALHGKKIGEYKLSLVEVVPEEEGSTQRPGTGKWKRREEGAAQSRGKKGGSGFKTAGPYHGSTVRRGGQRGQ